MCNAHLFLEHHANRMLAHVKAASLGVKLYASRVHGRIIGQEIGIMLPYHEIRFSMDVCSQIIPNRGA